MIVVVSLLFVWLVTAFVRGWRESSRQRAQLDRAVISGRGIAEALRRRGAA